MTLEEYLRLRKLVTTTIQATTETLKLDYNNQMNVKTNSLQIVNTLTIHQNIIISVTFIFLSILTIIGGITTYLMKDVRHKLYSIIFFQFLYFNRK